LKSATAFSASMRVAAVAACLCAVNGFAPAPKSAPRRAARVEAAPTAEAIEGVSAYKVTLTVPGAVTKAAYGRAATDIAKTREIPGWRPQDAAKVPAAIVANTVGADLIKGKAIEGISESEVPSAITGLGIEAVGQAELLESPDAMVARFVPGEDFELVVRVDVWPEATWTTPYDDGTLSVTVEREPKDTSVREKAMQALRERYVDKVATGADYACQMGDVVIVDMDGYERDEAGGNKGPLPVQGTIGGEDLEVVLEVGKFLPGVVEALIGSKAGDEMTVPVDFPGEKAYRDRQPLAGVQAAFVIKVKEVQTRQLPALDDAFASKIRDGLTLAELEQQVEDTVGQQETGRDDEKLFDALEKALAARVTCPLPESVVMASAKQKFAVMLADMRSAGTPDSQLKQMVSPEGFQKFLKIVEPQVSRDLRARLAVESIGKREAIAVAEAQVEEQMEFVRRQYEQQQSQAGAAPQSFDDDAARVKVTSELLRQNVLEYVKSVAKVTYVDAKVEVSA